MHVVRVQYTVKPEYVQTNQKNIKAVMDELEKNPIDGFWYKAFLLEDGQSFMHLSISENEETMGKINGVEQFNTFRKELKESEPVNPPKLEKLVMVV